MTYKKKKNSNQVSVTVKFIEYVTIYLLLI